MSFLFILKRVLLSFLILGFFGLFFAESKLLFSIGLISGTLFGLFKFKGWSNLFTTVLSPTASQTGIIRHTVLHFLINQISFILLLALSLIFNFSLFLGVTIGILTIPFVIFINGLTEGFGLTHNSFK